MTARRIIYPASTPRTLLLVAAPQQQQPVYTIRRPIAPADTKPSPLGKRKVPEQYVDVMRDSDGESDCESDSTNTYSHDEIEIEEDLKLYRQKLADENDGAPVRKRERLTHLSPEEKMWRRKMKNRIAAQTARDRKKARMDNIEDAVQKLERQNRILAAENAQLRKQNAELMAKMNAIEQRNVATDVEQFNTPMNTPVESAARTGSDIGGIDNSTLHICDIDLQRIIDDLLRDAPVEGEQQQQHVNIADIIDATTTQSSSYEYTSTDGETSSSSSFTTTLDDMTQQIDDDNILQQTPIQDVPNTPPSAMLLLDADLIDINRCFDDKSLQDNNSHLYGGSPVWNEDFSDLFDIVN